MEITEDGVGAMACRVKREWEGVPVGRRDDQDGHRVVGRPEERLHVIREVFRAGYVVSRVLMKKTGEKIFPV